jgi:hypothetical protein
MLDKMRGVVVVRGARSRTWLGNKYIPSVGTCTTLEDWGGEPISPPGANCNYCFPDVYLDYTKISSSRTAVNIAQFNPDQLEAMEVYLGAAETPMRYASGLTGCGVIVLHTRAVESKPRVIAQRPQTGPTRSKFLVNVSAAAGHPGANCTACGFGSAFDGSVGYTLSDRWVVGGRYAKWAGSRNAPQSLSMKTVNLEWYPHPEPGRVKWFTNVGVGAMTVDLHSQTNGEVYDEYTGGGLPSAMFGTGADITLMRRLVLTPFLSHSRNFGGQVRMNHCISQFPTSGPVSTACFPVPANRHFTFTQLGTRVGWR